MHKIGLKLWSINTDYYYDEAKRLYNAGVFDYIELYIVPDTLDKIARWKSLGIPFSLHAPYIIHQVNLASKENEKYNLEIYKQVQKYAESLSAIYVVIHGGIEGYIEETIRQLNLIKKNFKTKLLIENKPYISPIGNKICRGATIEEIDKIIKKVNCGFCLDIGHAICTANYLNKDIYSYIKEYNDKFNPECYHFSDNDSSSITDRHLHFGDGNFDFTRILNIIDDDKNITIETRKNSKILLSDFYNDANFLKGIICK